MSTNPYLRFFTSLELIFILMPTALKAGAASFLIMPTAVDIAVGRHPYFILILSSPQKELHFLLKKYFILLVEKKMKVQF